MMTELDGRYFRGPGRATARCGHCHCRFCQIVLSRLAIGDTRRQGYAKITGMRFSDFAAEVQEACKG